MKEATQIVPGGENVQEEPTLEEMFQSLDGILEELEKKETSLEDSFRIYQTGMDLIRRCSQKIDLVEKKVLMMEEGELHEF